METLIVLIMVCGSPDLIIIREPEQQPYYIYYEDLYKDRNISNHVYNLVQQENEKIIIDNTRGVCI